MTHSNKAVQVGGTWLALASFLMIAVLAFHGPIASNLSDQMTRIADATLQWSAVHWIAAAAMSTYAIAGLIMLTSRSRLTEGFWSMTAWAVISVGALWTITTAVVETTVLAKAASTGSIETFEEWWAFAEGKGNGFAFLALAVAVIAGSEARSPDRVLPRWSARTGTVAGAASFASWSLGMWFSIGIGNLLWVAFTIIMCMWTLWFGVMLMRTHINTT